MTEKEFIEQIAQGTLVENDIIAYARTVDNKQSLVDHLFELQHGFFIYGLFCSNFTDAELDRLYDAEEILCSRFQLYPWEETEAASQKQLDLNNGSQTVFVDPQPRVSPDQMDQIAEHVAERLKPGTAKEPKDPDKHDCFYSSKTNEYLATVYQRLIDMKYISSDRTTLKEWMAICGRSEDEKKVITWNGSQTQLAYLVWKLFQRDNPNSYCVITANCFVLRGGSIPKCQSMRNVINSKLKEQKWIKEFDYILGEITLEEYNKSKEI